MPDHEQQQTVAELSLEEKVQEALDAGIAPVDVAQKVLEQLHKVEPKVPGADAEEMRCRVTTIDEAKGTMQQMVMGPTSDYVLTLGMDYYLAYENRFENGTVQLTIKKEEAHS